MTLVTRFRPGMLTLLRVVNAPLMLLGWEPFVPRWAISVKVVRHAD